MLALLYANNPDGLRRLLVDHHDRIRSKLAEMFRTSLDDEGIDAAMNGAAFNVWESRLTFDSRRAGLASRSGRCRRCDARADGGRWPGTGRD
jgi:hypothetical protein